MGRSARVPAGRTRENEAIHQMQHLTDEIPHLIHEIEHLANEIPHLTNEIRHLTNEIRHLTNEIRHLTCEIRHLTHEIGHLMHEIRHLTNEIGHLTNEMCNLTNEIQHLKIEIIHLKIEIDDLKIDVIHLIAQFAVDNGQKRLHVEGKGDAMDRSAFALEPFTPTEEQALELIRQVAARARFSSHDAKARFIISCLDELEALIDDYGVCQPGRRKKISRAASVSNDALETLAQACDQSESLVTATGLTAAEVNGALAFDRAHSGTLSRLQTFTRGVEDTMAEKRAHIGRRFVRALKIARQLRMPEDTFETVPALQDVETAYRRKRRPKLERQVVGALRKAKRAVRTAPIDITLTTTSLAQPTHTTFKTEE
ncbi:MAG TPA: hypothetical protein VEK57_31740 [Thermoanaerobaculia bacterium]|nr:hypothetical protein [Thermoanaerobaculia bacterium]